MKFISIASEKIDIREEDEKWIYIPPRKSIFRLFSINNKLIIYNKFQHTCLPPLYTATNQPVTSSVYSSLSFFALYEFSIEYQSVGKTIISVHRSRRQKRCAFWNGIPSPLPLRCRSIFASSSPPEKLPFHFGHKETSYFEYNNSSSRVSLDRKINNGMNKEWIKT